jgi:hypothetical protein
MYFATVFNQGLSGNLPGLGVFPIWQEKHSLTFPSNALLHYYQHHWSFSGTLIQVTWGFWSLKYLKVYKSTTFWIFSDFFSFSHLFLWLEMHLLSKDYFFFPKLLSLDLRITMRWKRKFSGNILKPPNSSTFIYFCLQIFPKKV